MTAIKCAFIICHYQVRLGGHGAKSLNAVAVALNDSTVAFSDGQIPTDPVH